MTPIDAPLMPTASLVLQTLKHIPALNTISFTEKALIKENNAVSEWSGRNNAFLFTLSSQ